MRLSLQVCLCILVLLPGILLSQNGDSLLQKANELYDRDQLDSSVYYYQLVQTLNDPDFQLRALSGQVKIAVAQSKMDSARLLIERADEIILSAEIDLESLCRYKTMKAEYFRNNSQFDKALQLHQEVARQSAVEGVDSLVHANALYYTGLTFERLEKYDSSIVYVERSLDIFRQLIDTSALRFSSIYNGMAVCYYRANQLDQAEYYYIKAKTIAEDQLGPVSSDLAICLNNLASIYRSKEDYQEAIRCSEQALKIYFALEDDYGKSSSYYGLGVYHYFLGDYGQTKDYMEACIEIRERLFDEKHYSLIGPYEVLGIAHEEAGDYEKTLYYLREVRPKIKAAFGDNSIREGYNYENTAITYNVIGQLDSALHYIQLSNAILTKLLPENDYSLATHYYSYANVLFGVGQLEQAKSYIKKSTRICGALGMENSTEYAQNFALFGMILAEQAQWEEADRQFEIALSKIRINSEDTTQPTFQMNPNALALLNEYQDYLFRRYQYTNELDDLNRFEQFATIYLELSDAFRKQFIDPYTKSILIKDNAKVYQRNIGIYHQLFQETGEEKHLLSAYRFSEYSRTSMLRDLQDEKIKSYAGIPDSVLQKEKGLKKRIADLNQQMLESVNDEALKNQLFTAKQELNKFIENTREKYPRYFDLKFRSTVPELEEIQQLLTSNRSLVEYMTDDTAFYALLITPSAYDLFYIGNREEIRSDLQSWQGSITSQDFQAVSISGQKLYQRLWLPFASKLAGDQVTIIPADQLFYLNFEALVKSEKPGDYLIYDYEITYALSIAVLMGKHYKGNAQGIMAVTPGFENDLKAAYQENLDSLELLDEAYLRTLRQPWSVKLTKELESKYSVSAFVGANATEQAIKPNLHAGKILYFGTHAIANPLEPLRSKLVMAKDIGEQREDGYLHAYEIYGLPLQAELAVLNACESGLGNLQQGEGMISLAYSMHYAGCPSTVMSLWKVDEKISIRITGYFLENMAEGQSMGAALRQAKLKYLQHADVLQSHPFYWSGMVLMGKDQVVDFRPKSKLNWLYLVSILLVVGLLIWFFSIKKSS